MCTKQKDGEDRWKRAVRYKKVELSIMPEGPTSLVVESIGEAPAENKAQSGWPDKETCQRVLAAIREAWFTGKPWSNQPNTKAEGRFAPKLISSRFNIPARLAEHMVETWLMNDMLEVEVASAKKKLKGLKVIGTIE
jgi:hypothetical protein